MWRSLTSYYLILCYCQIGISIGRLADGWFPQMAPAELAPVLERLRGYAAEGFSRGKSRLDDAARRARAEQEGRTLTEIEDRRA